MSNLAESLAQLLDEALNELFEVTRDPGRQRSKTEAVYSSIKARVGALVSELPKVMEPARYYPKGCSSDPNNCAHHSSASTYCPWCGALL